MSADMARQGGRLQLEKFDLGLSLNMANMAKEWCSKAIIEDTQQRMEQPHAQVREEMMRGVLFPRHSKVKATIERHPAKVWQNQTDGCLLCQNGTAKNT